MKHPAVFTLLLYALSSPLLAVTIPITVKVVNGSDDTSITGKIIGTPVSESDSLAVQEVSLEIPGDTTLDLPSETVWSIEALVEGYWSETRVITCKAGEGVSLQMWPTGKIRGKLQMPRGEQMPSEMTARFQAPESSAATGSQVSILCPVSDDGGLSCTLPAIPTDLRLRAVGFVSHYFWDVAVPIREEKDLGTIELRRGASLVGRVETIDNAPAAVTVLEISPLDTDRERDDKDSRRFKNLVERQIVDSGFFHFEAIRPGAYKVTAKRAGYAPASIYPVTVMENAETDLKNPLVLSFPMSLTVNVSPTLDMSEKPWTVTIVAVSAIQGSGEVVARGGTSEDGVFFKEGLEPGTYIAIVENSVGDKLGRATVELDTVSATVDVELPIVWVEGTVRFGDEPLSANLLFGGDFGTEKMLMTSDEEGAFVGYLPHDGKWLVQVASSDPPIERKIPDVEVDEAGSNIARVDIVLPATRVLGTVFNEQGQPMAALVHASEVEINEPLAVRTGENGSFEINGLGEGMVAFYAERGEDLVSQEVTVEMIDGRTVDVQLVLRERQDINAKVVSESGVVPGALIWAWPYTAGTRSIHELVARTDVTGALTLSMPPTADQVQLVIFPPGHTLQVLPVQPLERLPDTFEVGTYGGEIVVQFEDDVDWFSPSARVPVVSTGDITFPSSVLWKWRQVNSVGERMSSSYVVPALPPAQYTVCLPARPELEEDEECASGYVGPGARLVLNVDDKSEE